MKNTIKILDTMNSLTSHFVLYKISRPKHYPEYLKVRFPYNDINAPYEIIDLRDMIVGVANTGESLTEQLEKWELSEIIPGLNLKDYVPYSKRKNK